MAVVNKVPARQRVGMKLADFSSGGVLPEGDYQVIESSFVLFQYTNKEGVAGATTTAHRLVLRPVTNGVAAADASTDHEQIYSVGNTADFVPSEDGNYLESTGQRTSLSKQSKYYAEYENLVNAGLPEDKWEAEGAALIVGMVGHIVHIAAPDYSRLRAQSAVGTGTVGAAPAKKRDFPETIPVFKTIISSPWDKGGKKVAAPKVAAKAAPAPAAAPAKVNGAPAPAPAAAEGGPDNRLASFLLDVIQGAGGKMNKTQARLQAHRKYNAAKVPAEEREAELKPAFDDEELLASILSSINCTVEGSDIVHVDYAG